MTLIRQDLTFDVTAALPAGSVGPGHALGHDRG